MYEKPQLTKAGYAGDVVLGISMLGPDPDGSSIPAEFEFADDPYTPELPLGQNT
jgi:hypothetical protein